MKHDAQLYNALIRMSHAIGKNPAYIQGAGGNTSIKLDDKRMAVKASGCHLKNMCAQQGYCLVDYPKLREYIDSPHHAAQNDIMDFVFPERKERPSMESGFHALLGSTVLHSHSVYVNVLTCSWQGWRELIRLFPQAIYIDYVAPGMSLSFAVKQKIDSMKHDHDAQVIFLQNHGIIINCHSCAQSLDLHEEVNEKIRQEFSLPEFSCKIQSQFDITKMQNEILFPDQAVYLAMADQSPLSRDVCEVIAAYTYIKDQILTLGWDAMFLKTGDCTALLNMESEKYRQRKIQ